MSSGRADADQSATTPAAQRWRLVRRLLPWGSLALALVSAVSMDRRPERARLSCVLPLIAVSIRATLPLAAAAVVAGAPFVVGRRLRHRVLATVVMGVAVGAAALAGAAQLIPPAPLRYVSGAIGTRVVDRA